MPSGIPFKREDYLELVDLTGRIIREDKTGCIDTSLQPILQRVNIPSENWLCLTTQFEEQTSTIVGHEHAISHYYETTKPDKSDEELGHSVH
ncbi:hypothetical protein [Vibrio spartinae]|uniref:Transposase n=1 Tax=Vibrio spartinae TaxID=1918945 RepID=A0ABX6R4A9_9VIBR|nr:hypothetical protein [Vibrio spartinae]QMV16334.1 hypothetical protein Vspart_03720 [Vibrio spartinae]